MKKYTWEMAEKEIAQKMKENTLASEVITEIKNRETKWKIVCITVSAFLVILIGLFSTK